MPATTLLLEAREALLMALALSVPVILVAALVGAVVASFQAATQIQDATLGHLSRLLAVAGALALLGPWMARELGQFAERVFSLAGR